jgi:protein-L-isoaspartate(D-aspartate) O-methyltransferase
MDETVIAQTGAVAPPARRGGAGRSADRPAGKGRVPERPSVEPAATGPGLVSDRNRQAMVEALQRGGLRDQRVLAAMLNVPRHVFVEQGLASRAYEDVALPIGHGQTISRPYTVARMIEIVCAQLDAGQMAGARVLEIGTGCGYQAAVLANLFGEVVSVERIRGLHERARANLRSLRLPNLRLVFGDGVEGVPKAAPFDLILAAAAGSEVPRAWLEQMKTGGRLLTPIVQAEGQVLQLIERRSREEWRLTVLDAVRFVPLRSGLA